MQNSLIPFSLVKTVSMKYLFMILCTLLSLRADDYQSTLRLQDYRTFMQEMAPLPREKQLERVNAYFNLIVNDYDINSWGTEDYWATPKEFIVRGCGDCEDFVIAKYFTLKELGVKPADLMILIVKVNGSRDYHAVLGYKNDHNEILILDNISWKILPIQKRTDLKILCNIHDSSPNKAKDPLIKQLSANFQNVISKINKGK